MNIPIVANHQILRYSVFFSDFPMPIARHLLRNDVLAAIKSGIASGAWTDNLPSERQLTERYQVSRGTLRYALKNLQEAGIIRAVAGSGYVIEKRLQVESSASDGISIGILIGTPYRNRGSQDGAWISTLQQRVAKRQWHVHIHDGIPEIKRSPKIGLKKLFRATQHSCWALIRCSHEAQSIFQSEGVPAIVCGTPFPGIDLPSVDINFRATGRHAAGVLAAKGHRRIGFVGRRNGFPGDEELFEGFKEGLAASPSGPSLKKIRYGNQITDFGPILEQTTQTKDPITGIFIDCPFRYLALFTQAIKAGIRVPEDLSLISRYDSDFLGFLTPEPARYQYDPKKMAHKIHSELESRIQGDVLKSKRSLVLPDYQPGASVSKAPGY
jgi:DNA-binding LacI/PurR family transcriptional regulator